jgi:DNA polymerase
MSGYVGLDFETYGAVDLPRHGLARYVGDKSFTPLIASFVEDYGTTRLDFVEDYSTSVRLLRQGIGSNTVIAHNAGFEQAVLNHIGISLPSSRFIDSAVVARAAGAAGKLEAAAPQLLDNDKLESGKNLMRLFSFPGKYQEESGSPLFDPQVVRDHPDEWNEYGHYCDVDAELGLGIVHGYLGRLTVQELKYMHVTMDMNATGWCVDVPLVEEMQRRYLENQDVALQKFRVDNDAFDLNLNSLKQLKEWCAERGVRARSFDEKHVESLKRRIINKLGTMPLDQYHDKQRHYSEVLALLETKQMLGGSSLKKLAVILDTSSEDLWRPGRHRLKDQYIHCGAGQTLRTTGRSVQMQNLKRLEVVQDMDDLLDPDSEWSNTKLAQNLRQVFTASDPNGRLIVGDFKSVESRGLAWLADEQWKLSAYRQGLDLYKVQAMRIYNVTDIDSVTPAQRQVGKTGELSCGYGAGPGAVQAFALNMGIEMTEAESADLVRNWREANPRIVDFWTVLNHMIHNVVEDGSPSERLGLEDGYELILKAVPVPASLKKLHPATISVEMQVRSQRGNEGTVLLKRYFHGCYVRGRNISYYRPTERKTGPVWKSHFVDPKTKQVRWYELYGGKLAGILTQSLCRELFMMAMVDVATYCSTTGGQVGLVGQFHDELVLDWRPGTWDLNEVRAALERMMSRPGPLTSFPLAADVKAAYRYIK